MQKQSIFIFEEASAITNEIKKFLEKEGFDIICENESFEKGKIIIDEIKPNIVVIAINKKTNFDGIQLGSYIHTNKKIPFLYITSVIDRITIERIKNTRPYGIVVKPFRDIDLILNIEIILNNFAYQNIDPLRTEEEIITEIPYRIRTVIDYINANIYRKIEIAELATLAKWKTHHFIRVFSKTIGLTPYQYILKRKVEIAKAIIEETDRSIQEIAYDLNFLTYSNFYLAFKKYYNSTPEEFRKFKRIQNFNFNTNTKDNFTEGIY